MYRINVVCGRVVFWREKSREEKKREREEDEEEAYERRKLERKLREKEAAYQEVWNQKCTVLDYYNGTSWISLLFAL